MSHELGYALAFFYKKSTRVFVQASKIKQMVGPMIVMLGNTYYVISKIM